MAVVLEGAGYRGSEASSGGVRSRGPSLTWRIDELVTHPLMIAAVQLVGRALSWPCGLGPTVS